MKRFASLLMIALIAAGCGDDADDIAKSENDRSEVVGDTGTDEPDRSTTSAPDEEREDLAIADKGFAYIADEPGKFGYGVIFENPNPRHIAAGISVNVTFFGPDDTVIASEDDRIEVLLPGQRAAIGNGVPDAPGVERMDVQARVDDWEVADQEFGAITVEGVNTVEEEYGGVRTTGLVKSTFTKDLENVQATAIYRTKDGAISAGTWTFIDFLPAEGQVGVELSTFSTPPNLGSTEIYVAITSLTLLAADED